MRSILFLLAGMTVGAVCGYLYGAMPPAPKGDLEALLTQPEDPLPIILEYAQRSAVHPESVVLAAHKHAGTAAVVICGLRAKGQFQNVVEEQRVFFVGGTPEKGYQVLTTDAPKPQQQLLPLVEMPKREEPPRREALEGQGRDALLEAIDTLGKENDRLRAIGETLLQEQKVAEELIRTLREKLQAIEAIVPPRRA